MIFLALLLAAQPDLAVRLAAKHPPAAQVVLAARSVPAEFGARALLRLAARVEGLDRPERAALLREAFELASAAQERVALRAIPGPLAGTRAQERGLASNTGIDRLSLQTAALLALLDIEPAAVRPLFETVAAPPIARARCRDALLVNPAKWYELVAALPRARWAEEELRREAHLAPLETAVRGIASPVEIAPALDAIAAAKLTADQQDRLIGAVSAALERVSGDDRAFTATLAELEQAVAKWPALRDSWKRYVAANLINTRCAETVDPQWPYLATLNRISGELELRADFDPESATTDRAELSPVLSGVQRAELERFADAVRQPRLDAAALHDLVESTESRVGAWHFPDTAGGEAADYRGYIQAALAAALPAGEAKERLLRSAVRAFSRGSARPEWFGVVQGLLNATAAADRLLLLTLYEQSGHPVLALEARLERVAPAFGPPGR